MIWNVIDNRKRRYRWRSVVAIVEPTWHDNSNEESDQAPRTDGESEYEERRQLSLAEAIDWAHAFPFPLFLYDDDGPGDRAAKKADRTS